jgi:3-hydroxyisobutyrate dehydrogenase
MLKDLKLAMEAAKQVGLDLEMGEEAEEEFEKFVERGGGNKDFSGIIQMIDGSWKVPNQE